jgi:hypothetical protein
MLSDVLYYNRTISAGLLVKARSKIKENVARNLKLATQCDKKHGIFMPVPVGKIYTAIEQNVIFFPGSIRKKHVPLLALPINEDSRDSFIRIIRKSYVRFFFELVCPMFCSTVIAESAESAKTTKHPHHEHENLLGL